jgi:hypothetical protein
LIQPGAFVRVLFPTRERPREPGLPHIGYVLVTARQAAIVAYTTSQAWPSDTPLPTGARLFNAAEAAHLNQSRAFLLRLDVLARLPMTTAWFPDIDHPEQAAVAIASPALQSELTRLAVNVGRRRRELIEMRGPYLPPR